MYECEWSLYLNGHIHSLRWQVLVVALSMYKVSHGHGVESVLHRQTGYVMKLHGSGKLVHNYAN